MQTFIAGLIFIVAQLATATPVVVSETPTPEVQTPELGALISDRFISLELEEGGPAVAYVPIGATSPRPVIVATHGNYDRPEWRCENWGYILPDTFVICPRGHRTRTSSRDGAQRYRYENYRTLLDEADAALALLQERFPGYIDPDAMMYVGFSQGAVMGRHVMRRYPERFPYAVLQEGGYDWSREQVADFADGGGRRVLFVCGQSDCNRRAERTARRMNRRGVETSIIYHERAGHTYNEPMINDTIELLPWLFEGDDRWGPLDRVRVYPHAPAFD